RRTRSSRDRPKFRIKSPKDASGWVRTRPGACSRTTVVFIDLPRAVRWLMQGIQPTEPAPPSALSVPTIPIQSISSAASFPDLLPLARLGTGQSAYVKSDGEPIARKLIREMSEVPCRYWRFTLVKEP